MRTVPVTGIDPVPVDVVASASDALRERPTLADVLQWAREQVPARQVVEIVTQDEYTHDVVIPFDGGHFLAFDAT